MTFDLVTIILEQVCLYVPLVVGAYISIALLKAPDISIESAFTFGAILGTKLLVATHLFPKPVSFMFVITASLLGGTLVGLISSTLTAWAKLPHLLSSILTIGLFHGLSQYVLGGAQVSLSRFNNPLELFVAIAHSPELPVLLSLSIGVVLYIFLLLKTQLGYACAVYGNNPHFFTHYNISTRFIFVSGICMSNACAGLSGYLVAQTSAFTDVGAGNGMALFCITALILGKTVVRTQRPFLFMIPVVGIVAYCCLQQLLLKVGFNLKYFTMIQSLLVASILIIKYRKMSANQTLSNMLGL
ncbi:MAG: hypothetical protein H6679_05865 [Epsilonproteobacteria bacterium]|nr:hypothetical protein [Campylobacterota bacterium]